MIGYKWQKFGFCYMTSNEKVKQINNDKEETIVESTYEGSLRSLLEKLQDSPRLDGNGKKKNT